MKSTRSSARSRVSRKKTDPAAVTEPLRALIRGLSRARGFTLFFAVCNSPVERDRLIVMLAEALPEITLHRVSLTKHSVDILTEIRESATKLNGPIMVTGLESAVSTGIERHDILTNLNLQRPLWRNSLAFPVVFWVPEYILGFLEREAPDFYDWRSDTIPFPEINVRDIDQFRRFEWSPMVEDNLSLEQRTGRIEELRSRLEKPSFSKSADIQTHARWLAELAAHLNFTGDVESSLSYYRKAAFIYEKNGDIKDHAMVSINITGILYENGDIEIDKALESVEKQLPIFEKLDDRRMYATALGLIANMIYDKGNLDEALELYEKEVSIYEKLGDKRNQAISLGNIAEILKDRGEIHHALELHRERLSVFEDIGDNDSIAHCLWSIGRIEIQLSRPRQALENLARSYTINLNLGHLLGICAVGLDYGRLLVETGAHEEGLAVLERSRDGFLKLGWKYLANETQRLIDALTGPESVSPPTQTAAP